MPRSLRDPGLFSFLSIAWALWLIAVILGEQVPANDGLGWDGVRFARYATGGPKALFDREINSYYVQRVGPSLVVHGVLRGLDLPFDPVTIRWTFLGMNLVLLSAAVVMLVDLGHRLHLSKPAQWLLFLGLFVTPENGRMPVYYANIGDAMAFTLGMAFLWGWVTRRACVLIVSSLIALISWPAAFYLLLPLIVWPREKREVDATAEPVRFDWKWGLAALPAGVLLLAASWRLAEMPPPPDWALRTWVSLLSNGWLFGLAALAAIAQVTPSLTRNAVSGWSAFSIVTAGALFLIGRAFVAATESGSLAFGQGTYWREVLLYVRTRPLAPLVGHAAYFGGLAAIAWLIWPRALAFARKLGPGPFLALALMGLQALDTESRRLNANWPLVALCLVAALEPWLPDRRTFGTLVVAIVVLSKLWWPWSGPLMFAEANEPGNYYNLQGPSMSDQAYLIHLIAIAVLGAFLASRLRNPPLGPSEAPSS